MENIRQKTVQIIYVCLIIHACMLTCATALPNVNSEASLKAAEKLLTEALKKEIDDELSDTVVRGRSEQTIDSPDIDAFTEVLEEAAKGVEDSYAEERRNSAKDGKAIGYSGIPTKSSKALGKPILSVGHVASEKQALEGDHAQQSASGLNDDKFAAKVNDVLMSGLGLTTKNDGGGLYKTESQPGGDFTVLGTKPKEDSTEKYTVKQQSVISPKNNKANTGNAYIAAPPQKQSKSSEDWNQLRDEDIASKISEFYKILQDYTGDSEMQTEPAFKQMNLRTRPKAPQLDQPLKLSSIGDDNKQKKSWFYKKVRDNPKLVAEIDKLAAKLKQDKHDSSDDAFPSFSQFFRHHRSSGSPGQGNGVIGHENPMSNQNGANDMFRRGGVRELDASFPWSKYFKVSKRDDLLNYQTGRREAGDADEQRFIDEIEARVAELQQQLSTKKHKKDISALRM